MIIAIDGHSACGKSTLAKDLATHLGYIYIDSGAMYRAATLYFRQKGISPEDVAHIQTALDDLKIDLHTGQPQKVFLNENAVTESIRANEINDWVSEYAVIPIVRKKMVELQRKMASNLSVVMDGRDIGSVVFPNAEIKFFVTADLKTRTLRRLKELQSRGIPAEFEAVKSNLLKRDHIDSTRTDSPLIQTLDAIVIDNSHMTQKEQLEYALNLIRNKFSVC